MLKRYLSTLLPAFLLLASSFDAWAQTGSVGIGTTAPNASAALDVSSTSKGLLPPRLNKAQRDAIAAPAAGLTIYNTDTNKLNTWNGTSWDATLGANEQTYQGAAVTFAYTGGPQTYTVPTGVFSLQVDAAGASGGGGYDVGSNLGGAGARVQATFAVTPGQVLTLYVGGVGGYTGAGGDFIRGGYNGGGRTNYGGSGGGATDVRSSGGQLADRLLVAGGGGGGGFNSRSSTQGGAGGNPTGGNGSPNGAGTGATQTGGGAAGGISDVATSGGLGVGGDGSSYTGGGGGGGGYYGGGGASYNSAGGGGSSWVAPSGSSGVSMTAGYRAGNGTLTLTPGPQYASPVLNGGNFVNVPGAWSVNGTSYYYNGGNVGIGTITPNASAALDVSSTSKGLLPPRLTLVQRDAIQPGTSAAGLTIYNTSTNALQVWNGTSWVEALTSATQPVVQNTPLTFAYTGGVQTYTVPAGVYSLGISASGAQGGVNLDGNPGGLGGLVATTLAVTPGETLTLYVGGQGTTSPRSGSGGAGYNGGGQGSSLNGGGGGATDLRRSTTVPSTSLADRLVVAGGGGGASSRTGGNGTGRGGAGGGLSGGAGTGYASGQGGTQSGGGAGTGANSTGTLGQGGTGTYTGGGGGYYGGGGAGAAGGGGGSGYVAAAGTSGTTQTTGVQSGNGSLTITPGVAYAEPAISGANFVNVPGDNLGNHTATQALNLGTNALVGNGGSTGLTIAANGTVTTAGALTATGATKLNALAGSSTRMVTVAADGMLAATALPTDAQQLSISGTNLALTNGGSVALASLGDNLGNHTATQNLNLGTYQLVGNGSNTGITITSSGTVATSGDATISGQLTAAGATLGSATGAVILPGLSTAGFVTNSASGQLGTTTAASLGASFVLNQSSPQTGASFNVSGAGTVGGAFTAGSAAVTGNATVGGSLGIGTSSPTGKLANTAGNVIATDGNGISQQGLGWVNTSSAGYAGVFYNANNAASGPGLAVKIASTAAAALDVSQGSSAGTAGTSLLRVNGSGAVGIGTTAPAGGLHITTGNGGAGTGTTTAGVVMSGSPGQPPYLELRGSGTGTSTTTPYIDFAEASDQDYTTRLISQGGTLNVNGSNALLLKVNGSVQATNVVYTSDVRFKTHVRPLTGALASVLALRGVRYEWNALGVKHGGRAGAPQVGVLAQEVEKIYPELVSTGADGYKAVNYAQLTPVLLEAIKEQQQQLEALKQQNATLKAEVTATTDAFEARLRRLEAGSEQAQR